MAITEDTPSFIDYLLKFFLALIEESYSFDMDKFF